MNEDAELSTVKKINIVGWLIMLAGIASALYFTFGFSQSVSAGDNEVINIGLQQNRLFGFLASLIAFLSGLLVILTTYAIEEICNVIYANTDFLSDKFPDN
jgi:hypothetical protein